MLRVGKGGRSPFGTSGEWREMGREGGTEGDAMEGESGVSAAAGDGEEVGAGDGGVEVCCGVVFCGGLGAV